MATSSLGDTGGVKAVAAHERLLDVMVEQMKLPLMQIARQAELGRLVNDHKQAIEIIELTAESALKLLENYALSTKLNRARHELQLEPVSVAGALNTTAHELDKLARQYDCELQLHLAGKYEPIMAHRIGLEAALSSLGYVFIEAQAASAHKKRPIVKLAAHRSHGSIVAGMFADNIGLSSDMYRRAKILYGRARQPLTQFTGGSGAGVFVADNLLSLMSAQLRIAHHQKLTGLAATFTPSSQLQMVQM